jgi:hypothetical protein
MTNTAKTPAALAASFATLASFAFVFIAMPLAALAPLASASVAI